MPTHHPSEATLLSYAAGTLPEAFSLVIATHLTSCAQCRNDVWLLEGLGSAVLEDLPPTPMRDNAMARVLARLDEPPPAEPSIINPNLPGPLRYVPLGWRWPLTPRVWWRLLETAGPGWAVLIDGMPGNALPRHTHSGLELTAVIQGTFEDENGAYNAGDVAETQGEHIDFPPTIVGHERCVCLLASEGMTLTGIIGRMQKLIRL